MKCPFHLHVWEMQIDSHGCSLDTTVWAEEARKWAQTIPSSTPKENPPDNDHRCLAYRARRVPDGTPFNHLAYQASCLET